MSLPSETTVKEIIKSMTGLCSDDWTTSKSKTRREVLFSGQVVFSNTKFDNKLKNSNWVLVVPFLSPYEAGNGHTYDVLANIPLCRLDGMKVEKYFNNMETDNG